MRRTAWFVLLVGAATLISGGSGEDCPTLLATAALADRRCTV
ncbi:MAG: hypothetical protein ACE5M4_10440 [Anaerolineales bacterium]